MPDVPRNVHSVRGAPGQIAARRWYRCGIEYERQDGHRPEAGDVCAVSDGGDAYATRLLEACAPRP